jgi:F420-non-reducing hydrogenase small subunit
VSGGVGGKPKLSVYWASSCGGCEIALVNIHERLLEVDRHFDFMFCPCLLDTKVEEVEALDDGAIAITLFNGAIRTTENLEMARLMRRKSRVLVAYGACAVSGGIPALANLVEGSIDPEAPLRRPRMVMPEGELELPELLSRVRALADVVDVDYRIPGCPPEPGQVWNVLEVLIAGGPLPPKGTILGGGVSSACEECGRVKADKRVTKFVRTYEVIADSQRCLLEQGFACMGAATRNGCGALCPSVNVPCAGCYGGAGDVLDPGAKMIAALGSALGADVAQLTDPAGTFYRFTMAHAPAPGGER